jgi:hypothetical protein
VLVHKCCAALEKAPGVGPCSEGTWMLQVPSHPAIHWLGLAELAEGKEEERRRRYRSSRTWLAPGRFFLQ